MGLLYNGFVAATFLLFAVLTGLSLVLNTLYWQPVEFAIALILFLVCGFVGVTGTYAYVEKHGFSKAAKVIIGFYTVLFTLFMALVMTIGKYTVLVFLLLYVIMMFCLDKMDRRFMGGADE